MEIYAIMYAKYKNNTQNFTYNQVILLEVQPHSSTVQLHYPDRDNSA